MTNEILLFITIIVSFTGVILSFRFWGKIGIFAWVAFASILANIEVIKCVDMFGMAVTLGNVLYGSTFLATDILNDKFGPQEGKKAIGIGFFALIAYTILSQLSLLFVPNDSDFASTAMDSIFHLSWRICAASLFAYFISNMLDIYLFNWFGKFTKHLWIKNNGGTIISQAVDTVLFTFLAFWRVFDNDVIWELMITTFAIKVIIAICDTPFVYWAKRINTNR